MRRHAPADDPKFAIYIVLDEPDGTTGTSGSTSDALILAKDIMTELLPYMGTGMLGIFIVMGVIIAITAILNRLTKK